MNLAMKVSLVVIAIVAAIGIAAAPTMIDRVRPPAPKDPIIETQRPVAGASESRRVPLRVSAVVAEAAPFAEAVASTGTLRAEEGVELQAEINGKIIAITFTEGAQVRRGELLVKLNDAELRATHARAVHRRQLAALREQRAALLLKERISNQEEYDTALNELEVQSAELALTEAQLAKTEIRAPFDGVVGLRYVSEGAFINATTRVATLQRIDRLKIDFAIPEKYAWRLSAGRPLTFRIAGGTEPIHGEIYAFDPRIDSGTRTLLVRGMCPNPGGRLLPGAFASIELTLDEVDNAILIPAIAVIPGVSEKNVFVARDGKAERRRVEVGYRTERTVRILSGLRPGEVIITSGLQQLRPGQAVETALLELPALTREREASTGQLRPGDPVGGDSRPTAGSSVTITSSMALP